jgi:hypothetical protein
MFVPNSRRNGECCCCWFCVEPGYIKYKRRVLAERQREIDALLEWMAEEDESERKLIKANNGKPSEG